MAAIDAVMESDNPDEMSESVIAAYIRRFRNQAPTPSDNRRQIPSGKFWWLDGSNEVERVMPKPATTAADEDYNDRYLRQLQESLESDNATNSFDNGIYIKNSRQRLINSTEFSQDTFNTYDSRSNNQRSGASVQLGSSDLDAAANLDNYAEKLLMKCDLLLKGYTSAKHPAVPREIDKRPNTFSGYNGADSSLRKYTTSKETLSDDSTLIPHERAIRGIKSRSSYVQYEEDFDRQESLSKASHVSKHDPISPLEMTLAVSDDSWAELLSTQKVASPTNKVCNLIADNDLMENASRQERFNENTDLSRNLIGSKEVIREVETIDPIHTSIVHAHSPNLFSTKKSATRDDSHNTDTGIDITTAESIPPSSSPSTSKRKADGGNHERLSLYLSSSSEMDFTALARRANSEMGGQSSRVGSRGEYSLDSSYCSVDRIAVEDSQHVLERLDEDDVAHNCQRITEVEEILHPKTDEGQSGEIEEDLATTEEIATPTASTPTAADAASHRVLVSIAVSVAVSAISDVDTDPVVNLNTEQQQTASQTQERTLAQERTLTQEEPHIPALIETAAPPPRLTEVEVAPYLEDEVTSLLWKRLCVVRNILKADDLH